MKKVDTQEYMSVLRSLTEQGHSVSVLVAGGSMSPFLAGGRDTVFFSKPGSPLRRGDIVFYMRPSGQYVMHRIRKVHRDGRLDIIGDAQTETETGVSPEQVFARADAVCRKGRQLSPGDFLWELFRGPWLLLVPFRHIIMKIYGFFKPAKPTERSDEKHRK